MAVTAPIDYGAAATWSAAYSMATGQSLSQIGVFLVFAALLLIHALLNTFGVNIGKVLSTVSAWWHVVGTLIIVGALWVAPIQHRSLGWVFSHEVSNTGFAAHGGLLGSGLYAFLIGLLMSQYTLTGYDASAHVAEETIDAAVEAPKGIIRSVYVSIIAGFILLLSVTAAIQDYDAARAAEGANGVPPAQIFLDAVGQRAGIALVVICGVAQFFCGMVSVTANSRMSYAFARDNALPGSRLWARMNPRTGTPTSSIWLCAGLSLFLTVPAIWSPVAFAAVTSVAVIGLYIAYATPILLRRLNPHFRMGRWNLGQWSPVVGWIAVVWVAIIVILFMMPQYYPGTPGDATFNYAPVTVAAVAIFASVSWFAGGRKHFMRDVPPGHDTRSASELLQE